MLKTVIRAESVPPSPPSPDDAVFPSAHAALKFAFNFTHGTLQKNVLAPPGGGSDRGLAGLDGAAQAGMVLCEVDRLSLLSRNLLKGRYTVQLEPCGCMKSCCRGTKENAGWKEAVEYLTEYVLIAELIPGNIRHHSLRRALVVRFLGIKQSFPTIATSCGLKRHTASDYYKAVVEHLRKQERHAFAAIEAKLTAAKIVVS